MSLPPLPAGLSFEKPKKRPARDKREAADRGPMRPTGEVHDGDTFKLPDGRNVRLFGADAFELKQTGKDRAGNTVPLGADARAALLPFAQPDATVTPTGAETYGRPVASLSRDGRDAAGTLLRDGNAIATPEYLKSDPIRLNDYMEAERFARQNQRGAWSTQFERPSNYRHGTPEPWATAQFTDTPGDDKQAVFFDDPTPFQGLRPEVAEGYSAIFQDLTSKPEDLLAYAKANGFKIDEADTRKRYASRDRDGRASGEFAYARTPRVLTDPGDGKLGAFARGVADPINMLDEMGAVVDSIVPNDRENVWDSDRRFGDILANNLDQNRSVLAYDDSAHPYMRFGGQLAGGLIVPGASVEGVGAAAARSVLEAGGTRFAAAQAARTAVVGRLATAGAAEGTLAGVGAGEDAKSRFQGGLIGAPAGAVLGAAAGTLAPKIAQLVGRPFNKLAGREGEAAAQDFTDGAIDTARSRASNDLQGDTPGDNTIPATMLNVTPADDSRRVTDFSVGTLNPKARQAIASRRGYDANVSQFGPVHYDLAGKWPKALERMAADDAGDIPGAVKHPDAGHLDLVWGNDDFGVKRVVADDPETAERLPSIIAGLPVRERPDADKAGRWVFEDADYRAVASPDQNGSTRRWVVTSFTDKNLADRPLPPLPEGLSMEPPAIAGAVDDLASPPPIIAGAPATRPTGADRIGAAMEAHGLARTPGLSRAARPTEAVAPNIPPMDEASNLGPKSVLSFVPRTGKPGVSVISDDPNLAVAVYRDADGVARGAAQIPLTPEAREIFEGASVYVAPELRRKGIAASLYDALEQEGYPVGVQSGAGDLTPDGAAFVSSWRSKGSPATPRARDTIDVATRPRPLLDPATTAERRAQAEAIVPGDVVPLPANRVDGVDEAMRIDAGRIEPVRAPDEMAELSRRSLPSPVDATRTIPKRGPVDLVTYLRTQGGLRGEGGELQHLGIDNAPRKGMDFAGGEQRFGRLVDPNGMGYDEAATRAWEAGYFPDHAEPPTISEFVDALADTHSGRNRSFLTDDLEEVDRFAAARQQRYDVEAAAQEGDPLYQDRSEPVTEADLDAMSAPVTAYEEWGENAPRLAGNLRLDKLDSPESIKRALVATHARVGGFDPATRGRITQAETKALADDLGMTADDLLKRRKGEAFNAEEALAARQILAKSSTELVQLARRITNTDTAGDELDAAFREAWLRHVAIQEQVSGMTAEAGRALAQFRQVASAKGVGRVLPSLGDGLRGDARARSVAQMIVDLESAGVGAGNVNKFVVKSLKPTWKDKAIELYYNSLLSSPATHATNILSNTLTAMGQIPEHAVAAGIGTVRRVMSSRDIDRVTFSETGSRAVGLVQGTKDGLGEMVRMFRTGDATDNVTKMETKAQEAISGIKGAIIRIPSRALGAEDELFKAMARRMELNGLATRQAGREGLTGKAARDRASALVANPPAAMEAAAADYGRYLTFQTQVGSAGRKLMGITQDVPALKVIIPFVRTPINIMKFAGERSPLAAFSKRWKADIKAGGARRDLAISKVTLGTGLGATIVAMAAEGKITGGGPADDNARRALLANGWQPYSFKIGDDYYSYSRLDPFALTIGTAADMVDLQSYMTDKQRDHSSMLVAVSIAHNLASKTWLTGLSGALEALNDPDRTMDSFVSRTITSMVVPSVVNATTRVTDPVLREARGPMDTIRSRVPGLSGGLLPKRDIFGRVIRNEGSLGPDFLSPIRTAADRGDEVAKALLSTGATMGKPGKGAMTPELYDQFQERAGGLAHRRMATAIKTPAYQALGQDGRAELLEGIIRKSRSDAKEQLAQGLPASADLPAKPRRGRKALPVLPAGLKLEELPPLPPGLRLGNDADALPPLPPGLTMAHP